MRLSKLAQLLKQYDIAIEPGSKHFHARRKGYGVYAIPAHNGLKSEIANVYLRGLCRHFDIDLETLLK